MITETMTVEDILLIYRDDVYKLARYIPWLEDRLGKSVSSLYTQNGVTEHSVAFPVYDSNVLKFVNDATNSEFNDRNYRYVYSRNGLKTVQDELLFIDRITIQQIDQLGGIISHYVLGGRVKAKYWNDGVNNGVLYAAVCKAKELVDYWTNATN